MICMSGTSLRPEASQHPDYFTCVVPARLSAPRQATYQVKASSSDYIDVEAIARIEEPGRQLLRVTRTRYRDGAMTSEQTLQVLASTLAPISYLHTSARTPDAPPAKLTVERGMLTGHSYGNQPVNVSTGGQSVLFGNAPEEMLAAAVDWDRCAAVSAFHLPVNAPEIRRDVMIERTGEGSFLLDGRTLPVYQLRVTKEGYTYTAAVTRTAPFVVVSTTHSTPASSKQLIKLQ
jgi:hypothetical protein